MSMASGTEGNSEVSVDWETYYDSLPDVLQLQLKKMQRKCHRKKELRRKIGKVLDEIVAEEGRQTSASWPKEKWNKAMRLAIYKYFETRDVFEREWNDIVFAFDDKGNRIEIKHQIARGKNVIVMEGLMFAPEWKRGRSVIVKWYMAVRSDGRVRDVTYETESYCRLRKMGCPVPWFSSSYRFWRDPVLVLEKLLPVTKDCCPFEMGASVIEQLKYLHEYAIHNDIKPGNIMRKRKDGKDVFYLIDYGGIGKEPMKNGYKRSVWTPKFSEQPSHGKKQVTFPYYDFIELLYTMRCIEIWHAEDAGVDDDNNTIQKLKDTRAQVRRGIAGKLKEYKKYLKNIPMEINLDEKYYNDLIAILRS